MKNLSINWGASTSFDRGPIIATDTNEQHRNALGVHSGPHATYRALAVATGALDPRRRPDLTDTQPTDVIGPYQQWCNRKKIVAFDPWGHLVVDLYADWLKAGYDIRPTIAITHAHIRLLEIAAAMHSGHLKPDGKILKESGDCVVTKAAIEPVWYLPGVAERFGISEIQLRQSLVDHAGVTRDLLDRTDLKVFLPPSGGQTVYIFGDPQKLADPDTPLTARVHDECNGSDVFGSDICTCRPYLMHAIGECVRAAQQGGVGLVVYFRKEGRALGEVTKLLVYNRRKRQPGGDTADQYFACTECVAGVPDMRFQLLMPDVLHWLGVSKIHRLVSMSSDKYDAIVASGIKVLERIPIPAELVPADAHVEIAAKEAKGYFARDSKQIDPSEVVGRRLN